MELEIKNLDQLKHLIEEGHRWFRWVGATLRTTGPFDIEHVRQHHRLDLWFMQNTQCGFKLLCVDVTGHEVMIETKSQECGTLKKFIKSGFRSLRVKLQS